MKINKQKYIDALALVQSFETYWTFYWMSDGELYPDILKENKAMLFKLLKEIFRYDKLIFNSKVLTLDNNNNTKLISGIVKKLRDWDYKKALYPYHSRSESRYMISNFTMGLKIYLLKKVGTKEFPRMVFSNYEDRFAKSRIRWSAHLPFKLLHNLPKDFEDILSSTETIVVVADIRKSQDLMTYATTPNIFRDMTFELIDEGRKLIKDNNGIFDKFTGDGFLAYFNKSICKSTGNDHWHSFINFCNSFMPFCIEHFNKWVKNIKKMPAGSSGLTIGVDIGKIVFKDIDNHLFAIGDSIVWANRMCSAGKSNEIILNNLPYRSLSEKFPNLSFSKIESATKSGESFTVFPYNWQETLLAQ